jgi:hypothetical protein
MPIGQLNKRLKHTRGQIALQVEVRDLEIINNDFPPEIPYCTFQGGWYLGLYQLKCD